MSLANIESSPRASMISFLTLAHSTTGFGYVIAQGSSMAPTVRRPKESDTSGTITNGLVVVTAYIDIDNGLLDHEAQAISNPDDGPCLVLLRFICR